MVAGVAGVAAVEVARGRYLEERVAMRVVVERAVTMVAPMVMAALTVAATAVTAVETAVAGRVQATAEENVVVGTMAAMAAGVARVARVVGAKETAEAAEGAVGATDSAAAAAATANCSWWTLSALAAATGYPFPATSPHRTGASRPRRMLVPRRTWVPFPTLLRSRYHRH